MYDLLDETDDSNEDQGKQKGIRNIQTILTYDLLDETDDSNEVRPRKAKRNKKQSDNTNLTETIITSRVQHISTFISEGNSVDISLREKVENKLSQKMIFLAQPVQEINIYLLLAAIFQSYDIKPYHEFIPPNSSMAVAFPSSSNRVLYFPVFTSFNHTMKLRKSCLIGNLLND